jgi:N-methylhydantoinase A
VVTNLLLTGRGCEVGFLTTQGHRDVLSIMGGAWGNVEGVSDNEIRHIGQIDKPARVIPKRNIVEIDERVDYKGSVIIPLNEEQVREGVRRLLDQGVEAIAIGFLWSFKNPANEERAREIVREIAGEMYVSTSAGVIAKIGEFPRFSTAAVNSACGPAFASYIGALTEKLDRGGLKGPTLIMQSTGGVVAPEEAMSHAYQAVASGPVGGVVGSIAVGELYGLRNVICSDMGGTSFDVGLIIEGSALRRHMSLAGPHVVYAPSVDVVSVGAGGGSIAWVDRTGALRVGPQSAGAVPGPACYGRGGTLPTTTDADVVLGYLNPEHLLGGALSLSSDLAEAAIREHVAEPLGISIEEAAAGIVRVVDSHMADCMRQKTVEAGFDPRDFTVFAYGGAGPVHCAQYARELQVRDVVIPLGNVSSVFSAFGIAASPVRHLREMTAPLAEPIEREELERRFEPLVTSVRGKLTDGGFSDEQMALERFVDMKYRGQFYELEIGLGSGPLPDSDTLVSMFGDRYDRVYGSGAGFREAGVEVVNVRVVGEGRHEELALPEIRASVDQRSATGTTRRVYWPTIGAWKEARVIPAASLSQGATEMGPLVVEAPHTSIVVHPGDRLEVLDQGTVRLTISER